MKPQIIKSTFGSIEVDGDVFNHDIIIRLDGSINKRKKKLSKRKYGTSHKVSLKEMKYVFEDGASSLIVGAGQSDQLRLSRKAKKYLEDQECRLQLAPTQQAIALWNGSDPQSIALFHVTC